MDLRYFQFKGSTYPTAFELSGPTMIRNNDNNLVPRFSKINIFELGVCGLTLLDTYASDEPTRSQLFGAGVAVWEITDENILSEFELALTSQNVELYGFLIVRVYARIVNEELICRVRLSGGPRRDRRLNQVLEARHDPSTPGL